MSVFLGLFGPGPNPSACFVSDGRILFWAEEERFSRVKTSPNSYPFSAVQAGLAHLSLSPNDVKAVGYAWDCPNYQCSSVENLENTLALHPSPSDHLNRLAQQSLNLRYNPDIIASRISSLFTRLGRTVHLPIHFYPHHLSHAYSNTFFSTNEDQLIIINDGAGEITSTSVHVYSDGLVHPPILSVDLPHSLGSAYASITEYLGYRPYEDEGRVMGLSCYGSYSAYLIRDMSRVIGLSSSPQDPFYLTDPSYRYNGKRTIGSRFSDKLVDLFGPPRSSKQSPLDNHFKDIAFALQYQLETVLTSLVAHSVKLTGLTIASFSGGVHMNCKANAKIVSSNLLEKAFFNPASSDNGVSLGAAALVAKEYSSAFQASSVLPHLYHGTSYTDESIERTLSKNKIPYERCNNIAETCARLISTGSLIGWFQGRMEVGARALGARSILASPLNPHARDLVNINVKNRESWRPFCPSLKASSFSKYFLTTETSSIYDYMIVATDVTEESVSVIPSCVHVDKTARPQLVTAESNPLYYDLLDHLEKLTGHGIVLNTSFNVKGEPVVESPEQAVRTFYGSGLDYLAIGSFLISK